MIWLVLLLGLILRVIGINQSLWLDEATQAILSQDPIRNILFQRSADFHPPLSYLILHFWMFFGISEMWLRLPSVIFGILTIWVLYKFTSEVFNKKIGILSALLFSIAPYHIYYSQEVRMYSEATFFAIVSIYYFYKLTKEKIFKNSIIYILSSVALIYTHYDGFFLIFTQLIFLIFFKRDVLIFFFGNFLFIALIWLPWFPQFLTQLQGGSNIDQYLPGWRNILSVSFYKALPLIFFKFSFGRIDFDNLIFYIAIALVVLLIFGYVLYRGVSKTNSVESKLIICWLFIPIVTALIVSFKIPINQPFRVLYTLPAYYLLLAIGIYSLTKFKKIFFFSLIGISLLGLSFYYFNPNSWREDWREASKFVSERSNINNIILFAWPDPFPPFKWYSKNKQGSGIIYKFPATREEVERKMRILDDKKEVFLFEYLQSLSDPKKLIQEVLIAKGFTRAEIYNFRGVGFVDRYIKNEKNIY